MFKRALTWFREQATPRPFDASPRTGWRGVLLGRGLRGDGFPAASWTITALIGLATIVVLIAGGDWLFAGLVALIWVPLGAYAIAQAIRHVRERDFL
jgi:hypothetical protein